jgi:hypothetical protein
MPEIASVLSPHDTIRDGLRVLAQIIAREVLKDRLVKIGGLRSDSPSTDVTFVETDKYLKGTAQ